MSNDKVLSEEGIKSRSISNVAAVLWQTKPCGCAMTGVIPGEFKKLLVYLKNLTEIIYLVYFVDNKRFLK